MAVESIIIVEDAYSTLSGLVKLLYIMVKEDCDVFLQLDDVRKLQF